VPPICCRSIVTSTSATRERWIDTLRPRFGYAWDRFMIYGTAGVGLGRTDVTVSNAAFGSFTNSQNRVGWTAGLGGEGRPGSVHGGR